MLYKNMWLETNRLIIRDFSQQDLEPLAQLFAHPEVMRFSRAGPLSLQQTQELLEHRILGHYAQHGFGLWALIHKENHQFIGVAGFSFQTVDGEEWPELGYRLYPAYWGNGLASEACKAIVEYGFQHLGLDRIISIIEAANKRSIQVALGVGMHYWKNAIFYEKPVQIYTLRKIVVSPFDSAWKTMFETEKRELQHVFKDFPLAFFHIGSTSIPGCSAKPVIDILGVTPDILEIDAFDSAMIERGWRPRGEYGIKQRRFFQKKDQPPVNLHVFEESDPEVKRHLRFCEYLRSHPEKVREYSTLKETLAKQFPHSMHSYLLGKEKWIKEIDLLAAQEAPLEPAPLKVQRQREQWTLGEIKQAMEANMHLHMTYFAKYVPTMEIVFEPDVTVVRSQIEDDTFNYVLSAHFTEKNARDRIRHVRSLYRNTLKNREFDQEGLQDFCSEQAIIAERQGASENENFVANPTQSKTDSSRYFGIFQRAHLPFSWWVAETDSPADLADALQQEGFALKEKNVGMYAKLNDLPVAMTPLKVQRVESAMALKEFTEVIASIGGSPLAFDRIYSHAPLVTYAGNTSVELYLGFFENTPSVTGILVTHANVAGIYYVATRPEQRKKGFGTAMMCHLLKRAKQKGYFIATLQASEDGIPLYEKLGFQRCSAFLEYAPTKQ